MKRLSLTLLAMLTCVSAFAQDFSDKITLVIHGGAGTITRANMSPESEKAYRNAMNTALEKGYDVLKKGGTSVQAVEAAIHVMEDSPLFNAGKGAVFTNESKNELDAAIMEGKTLKAGAVAGVTTIKNPISAAIAVMDQSVHVMMAGKGAEQFAKEKGLEIVAPSYFYTEARYKALERAKEAEKGEKEDGVKGGKEDGGKGKKGSGPFVPSSHSSLSSPSSPSSLSSPSSHSSHSSPSSINSTEDLIFTEGKKFGTVGCVALDKYGNLAAGTSTGGMTNKRYGRIGDAPIIGVGTYANNATCAVSATGHGEYFIRSVVAHDISALMEYKGMSLGDAANEVVMKKLVERGGEGGVIAVDRNGNVAMPFNSEGMYRGYIKADGKREILIYKD
ncbi:beta-aspartyl-peptidase (threonine type) [Dyadobacter soli]|uniref:Isoaspartyl peptidase n=1 Tax=Dyadobacter soli TaxID=659014 RepID=A0A1G6XGC7_9BACT|nr:isoaspartyl peptidase/L-asparaginase [Dyadobacter soli]SDD77220.1 beta-aspartyl-peptidase (threonine type) [Dyadobacter soli]